MSESFQIRHVLKYRISSYLFHTKTLILPKLAYTFIAILNLSFESIYDIPLRVTFYARVSSEKDEQLNSLDNQISYYRNFINKNANWEFVEGYIDEGLSGISTKNQKFLPPEEWVMFKDETGEIVPAIVSEELWEQSNAVLKRRSRDVKNRQNQCNHPNLLTGKMYCTHCGKLYYRKDSKDRNGNILSRWICSGKINNGTDSCPSFTIYEKEIKKVLYEVFKDTAEDAKLIIEEYANLYAEVTAKDTSSVDLQKLKDRLQLLSKKKSKLLEYNIAGEISDRDFVEMNKQISEESTEIYSTIEEMENEINSLPGLLFLYNKICLILPLSFIQFKQYTNP